MTTKKEYQQAIRKKCLNCCGGSCIDVQDCRSGPDASPYSTCDLWHFRLGTDPNPSESRVEAGKRKAEILHPSKTEEATIAQASIPACPVT